MKIVYLQVLISVPHIFFFRVSKNMASSQILRKMFPRPEFVPPESEVALEKTLYIDGPKSQLFEVVGLKSNTIKIICLIYMPFWVMFF